MSEEVDFWSATVQAYAPLQLPKPELTTKYLKRPPFRFIHEIVSAIDERFAAYDHVIPAGYQDVAAIDTKEKKVEYLQALIDYVEKLIKVTIDVNPKKIVSGHESEKTNVFLQYLAMAIGLAQQEKAARVSPTASGTAEKKSKKSKTKQGGDASSPPPPPTPPPPPPPPSTAHGQAAMGPSAAAPPALHTPFATRDGLPSRDSLPRKASSTVSATDRAAANQRAIAEALAFNNKLAGYSINLSSAGGDGAEVKRDNESIVKMWKELQHRKVGTEPTTMPEDSLEKAIKRQMDALKQVQALLQENDTIIANLEGRIL